MSRKVLVVDDEKLIVKGIRFSLEQDGMEVDCAYDGEEAVEDLPAIRHIESADAVVVNNDALVGNATELWSAYNGV